MLAARLDVIDSYNSESKGRGRQHDIRGKACPSTLTGLKGLGRPSWMSGQAEETQAGLVLGESASAVPLGASVD